MSDKHARTERATSKRREKAFEEGQVLRSREATGAFTFITTIAAFLILQGSVAQNLMASMEYFFSHTTWIRPVEATAAEAGRRAFFMGGPLFAVAIGASVTGSLLQGKATWTAVPFTPKPKRLFSPSKLTQAFSLSGVSNLVRGVIGLGALTIAGWWILAPELGGLSRIPELDTLSITMWAGGLVVQLLVRAAVIFAAIGAVDYAVSYRQHEKSLRMTKQEVKEENKQLEGNPQIKGRIRRAQRELSKKRMMAMIPQASVVIVNPTHVSVALLYDPAQSPAPQVIGKGKGELAQRIREIARKNDVVIYEDPPLARALYAVELGAMIPAELFAAVAEVLAYLVRASRMRSS